MRNTLINFYSCALVFITLISTGCMKRTDYVPPSPGDYSTPGQTTSGKKKVGKPYQIAGKWYYPLQSAQGYDEHGIASWYGRDFHGKATANGERYDMHAMTAAHTTLPLPTMVRVTNLDNNRQVIVRVNDRGPFVKNRLIDLSYAAAKALGYDQRGTARVRVQALDDHYRASSQPASVVAATPAPVAQAVAPTTTVSRSSNSSMGQIYIQLGAFSTFSNARRLQQQIRDQFPNVSIDSPPAGSAGWYRVQIGPFDDVAEVEQHVLQLEQQNHSAVVVIR